MDVINVVVDSTQINGKTIESVFDDMLSAYPWLSKRVALEPVSGLVDGSNRRFNLSHFPARNIIVYDDDGNTVGVSSFDEDAGIIITSNAPQYQLYASYINVLIPASGVSGIVEAAVALSEELLPRGAAVVDGYVATQLHTPIQRRFLSNCIYYTWMESNWGEAVMNAISVREQRSSGLQIDRTRQPEAYRTFLDAARTALISSRDAAAAELNIAVGMLAEVALIPGRRTSRQPNGGLDGTPIFPYP